MGEDFSILLAKGPCFGSCPVYSMKIDQFGYAIFEGVRFTDKIGKHALHLTKPELDEIAHTFHEADLHQYDNDYNSEMVDLPLITIGFTNNETSKIVRGKSERPQPVVDLQIMLEEIAHREGWESLDTVKVEEIISEKEEEEEKPKEIIVDSEIIITFQQGTIISRWMKKWRDYDMYVQKPMTEDRNSWIVQFNKSKIEPKELLQKILADEGVASAEFNKIILEPEVK